jgi:hypothetical protein
MEILFLSPNDDTKHYGYQKKQPRFLNHFRFFFLLLSISGCKIIIWINFEMFQCIIKLLVIFSFSKSLKLEGKYFLSFFKKNISLFPFALLSFDDAIILPIVQNYYIP